MDKHACTWLAKATPTCRPFGPPHTEGTSAKQQHAFSSFAGKTTQFGDTSWINKAKRDCNWATALGWTCLWWVALKVK
jgi:hypothetical protein